VCDGYAEAREAKEQARKDPSRNRWERLCPESFRIIQGIATAMNITTNSGDGQRSRHRSCVEKLRESAPLVTVVSIRAVPSEAKHKLVLIVTVCYQGVAGFCVPSQPVSATTSNKR
jgi:hypothetical protein